MGFSCLDCPHHGCNLPFYPAADKQGIRREKPLNDFLIKPQIRVEQHYYLPLAVIYSPDCCSVGANGGSASAGEDAGAGRGAQPAAGCCEGMPGQGPPALLPDPPTAPSALAREGFDAINIKTRGKKKNSRKEVQSGITKSEAREQKSPLAPFLGTENGFPEQYHSFDMPVLVSRLPEDENRLKKNLLGGSAHCNATSNAIKRSTPAPGAPHPHALVVK